MSAAGSAAREKKRKNFNDSEKNEVIRYLLAGSTAGVLRRGAYKDAGEKFGCYWKTIKRLWTEYDQQHKAGVANPQLANRRKGNSGRKGIDAEGLRVRLRDIPVNDRTTQRRLAAALGIPYSTLHGNLKKLGLRAHSNARKPLLTNEGKDKAARAGTPIPERYPISEEAWTNGWTALAAAAGQGAAAGGQGTAAS